MFIEHHILCLYLSISFFTKYIKRNQNLSINCFIILEKHYFQSFIIIYTLSKELKKALYNHHSACKLLFCISLYHLFSNCARSFTISSSSFRSCSFDCCNDSSACFRSSSACFRNTCSWRHSSSD